MWLLLVILGLTEAPTGPPLPSYMAAAQLPVNYLAQQANSLSAQWVAPPLEQHKRTKTALRSTGLACLPDDWGYCGTFVTYLWGLSPSDASTRQAAASITQTATQELLVGRLDVWDHGSPLDIFINKDQIIIQVNYTIYTHQRAQRCCTCTPAFIVHTYLPSIIILLASTVFIIQLTKNIFFCSLVGDISHSISL